MTQPVDLAWAAGVFDGEGSCSITEGRWDGYRYFTLRVCVGMNHRPTVARLQELFGGRINIDTALARQRPLYRWVLSTLQAHPFLEAIRPYAVTKAPQIWLALEFITNRYGDTGRLRGQGARLTEEQRALARGYHFAMKELNRNGCV